MTKSTALAVWQSPEPPVVPDSVSDPQQLVGYALQLRDRERRQLASSFENESFEVAATFIWARSMSLLRKQLASLGSEFIGDLIQRSGVDENTDIASILTDFETISLARDLGLVSAIQAMRLFHSRDIVSHFSSVGDDAGHFEDEMTREDAVSCLRICVQTVLSQENVGVAQDFKQFRDRLASETFAVNSDEVTKLAGSPYLFIRTSVSVLLSLFKSTKGAQLEHTSRNALLIFPVIWDKLKAPERWQVGQAYASEFSEGRKEAARGLHAVLIKVNGFDYVPETLRSNTFIKAAQAVISAHQGMNNFYNEPAPMKELASLGTSIPGPAVAICMTALLCVKLGNRYGVSFEAQGSADRLIDGLSIDRWYYYLNEKIEDDRIILSKLTDDSCVSRWVDLIRSVKIDGEAIRDRRVRNLITIKGVIARAQISTEARRLFEKSFS